MGGGLGGAKIARDRTLGGIGILEELFLGWGRKVTALEAGR